MPDKSGYIEIFEFTQIYNLIFGTPTKIGINESISYLQEGENKELEIECSKLFNTIDSNGDGKIALPEFVLVLKNDPVFVDAITLI